MTNDPRGGLAQLARALALQARGHRFDSDILHQKEFFQTVRCNRKQAVDWFKANYITKDPRSNPG